MDNITNIDEANACRRLAFEELDQVSTALTRELTDAELEAMSGGAGWNLAQNKRAA